MNAASSSTTTAPLPARRRRRWVFGVCAAVLISSICGWIFSYYRVIDLAAPSEAGHPRLQLFLNRGLILFFVFPKPGLSLPAHADVSYYSVPADFDANYWRRSRLGFSTASPRIPEQGTRRSDGSYSIPAGTPWVIRREWGVPYWSVTVLTGAATLLAFRPIARRRRWLRAGRCEACGYDLRGNVGRCPECGREREARP